MHQPFIAMTNLAAVCLVKRGEGREGEREGGREGGRERERES